MEPAGCVCTVCVLTRLLLLCTRLEPCFEDEGKTNRYDDQETRNHEVRASTINPVPVLELCYSAPSSSRRRHIPLEQTTMAPVRITSPPSPPLSVGGTCHWGTHFRCLGCPDASFRAVRENLGRPGETWEPDGLRLDLGRTHQEFSLLSPACCAPTRRFATCCARGRPAQTPRRLPRPRPVRADQRARHAGPAQGGGRSRAPDPQLRVLHSAPPARRGLLSCRRSGPLQEAAEEKWRKYSSLGSSLCPLSS